MPSNSLPAARCPYGCDAFADLDSICIGCFVVRSVKPAPRYFDQTTLRVAIRTCDPFQGAHGPAYRLGRIAELIRLQPEVAS